LGGELLTRGYEGVGKGGESRVLKGGVT